MPCCSAVLSAAAAASRTPPWLHRLHAKGGLSFPSNLHIDDLLYGQRRGLPPPPRPPPSSSNPKEPPPPAKPKQPKPKQQQQPPPPQKPLQLTNASLPNPSSSGNPPPPQLQLSAIVADIFVTPSSAPPAIPPIKAFRKQNRPRPRPDKSSRPRKENKDKAKVKKRCRSERAADTDRERCTRTEVTVIDTSTDGWKAAKLLLRRGAVWKVRDKTSAVSEPEDPTKVKRRAGLVSKIQRDREKQKQKEKEATSLGNIHATSSGDVMKESDGLIQALKRSRCSEPEPEGQIVALLH